MPVFVAADVLLFVLGVAQRNLGLVVLELEGLEDVEDDVHHLQELVLDLVGGAVDVSVVLGEAAHAGEAVELARLLVAVYRAEFGQAQGQLAVRAGQGAEDFAVVGAVHRLEQVFLAFLGGVDGLERVLAVLGVVSRGDVEALVADVRGDDLLVAVLLLYLAQELLEAVAQGGAFGEPQGQAGADVAAEGEELHLLAELAVVALLGLLEEGEVLVQHLFLGEGDAVDAYKLVALFVAAPVCAGEAGNLGGLDGAGVGQVRATAKVGEVALGVGGDVAVLKLADELALVCLAAVAEHLQGVGLADVLAHDGLLLAGELEHALLYFGKIGVGELVLARVDVIVEAVFDGGADAELHAGVKLLQGFGQQVGRRVPEGVLAFGVVPFEELKGGVLGDGAAKVPFLSVY